MLFFRFYSLREPDMDNKDEVLLTSLFLVAQYLCNTNRVPNAIEMCKDVLLLLDHKTLGNIAQTCVKRFENVHSNPVKPSTKLLFTFRQVFARKVELSTTYLLAELYGSQREYSDAEGLYLKALNIAEKIGDRVTEAKCYGNLAMMFYVLGESVKVEEYLEKLLPIVQKIGDREVEAKYRENLGTIFTSLGNYVKAKEHCEKAIAIAEKIGDREAEAKCYGNLGRIFQSLGEYVRAKEHYKKAIAIAEKIGDRETEATSYPNLGIIFNSLGEYVKAKEHSEKALAIAEKIGDRTIEAACYASLGSIFKSLGECVKAKEHSEKAIAIAEKIGDRIIEATSYQNLGIISDSLGEYVKAKEHYEKAIAIAEKIGNRKIEATSYRSLGIIFGFLGEYVKAKEHSEKAIAIAEKIGDREIEATSYVNLGNTFQCLGENVKAKGHLEKALAIAEEICDRTIEAASYQNLGIVFHFLSEYVKAKEHCEKAFAIEEEIGNRIEEARSYGNLVRILESLGECVKDKEHDEKTLAMAEKIGDGKLEPAYYMKLGIIFTSIGEYVKAQEHFEKALAIAEKIGDIANEARIYGRLGNLFKSLGEYGKAKEHYEKALAIAEKIGNRVIEAKIYHNLASTVYFLDEHAKAKEFLEKAIVLHRKYGNSEDESFSHFLLSALMFLEGNMSEFKSNAFVSFEKIEVTRRLQVHDKFKISYFERIFNKYQILSPVLCAANFPHEALYTEEYRRARALTDLMAARYSVENEIPVSTQTWDYIESIVKKECNCACLYISYYEQSINLWVVKADKPLIFQQIKVNDVFGSVIEVADLLSRGIYREVLCLAPEQCEDRSWLPSNAYREQGCERLTGEEDEVENQPPERTPACLYKMIIAPVADSLDKPEIIIVPDRHLYKVPFAALEDKDGKCLSETFRIRIVPSLITLKFIQDSPADYHSQSGVLIVGDPHVGEVSYNGILQWVSRLPFANKEAEMIGKLFGTQPLLGKQATKQAVLQNIHSVSLIHFACHGNAERGEIVLAPPPLTDRTPQEEDYLLTMENISKVKLRAKLVVLSCCHSAKGQISAEGVVGIARAFLGSGARSVLAALWAIDDEATEHFMTHFYENLVHGERVSESLQQAMKWMRENGFSEISQWAPFMLIGDNVKLDIHKLRSSKGQ